MARTISSGLLSKYGSIQFIPIALIDFTDGDYTYRYTNLDVPYTVSSGTTTSGTFESRGFEFESITYSTSNIIDEATIRIDNVDSVMTALFAGDSLQEQEANIYVGALTEDFELIDLVNIFKGEIDSFDLEETDIRLVIGTPFARWSHRSYEKQSTSCRWKVFKGTECAYAGSETWCDRSYTRCSVLGNTDNFGGNRWLTDIMNKTVWWGKTAPPDYSTGVGSSLGGDSGG